MSFHAMSQIAVRPCELVSQIPGAARMGLCLLLSLNDGLHHSLGTDMVIGILARKFDALRSVGTTTCAITVALAFYMEARCVFTLMLSWADFCGVPLWGWLFVRSLLVWFTMLYAPSYSLLRVAWLLLGFQWMSEVTTCGATDEDLYAWLAFTLPIDAVWTSLIVLLRVFLLLHHLVSAFAGHAQRRPRQARPHTIEKLKRLEFKESLFAQLNVGDDNRPAPECSCCHDVFSADRRIIATPCRHYFHESCLEQWLMVARTCPLCRCDLDEAASARLH
mmetsp:Transcript_87932/g.247046  ORF Transcript_87932/g.247046 Transcript_87932/m.247046 type:complete len:277 (+) Transcript_87932:66-896(+)